MNGESKMGKKLLCEFRIERIYFYILPTIKLCFYGEYISFHFSWLKWSFVIFYDY